MSATKAATSGSGRAVASIGSGSARLAVILVLLGVATPFSSSDAVAGECAGGTDGGNDTSLACGENASTRFGFSVAVGDGHGNETHTSTNSPESVAIGYNSYTGTLDADFNPTGYQNTAVGFDTFAASSHATALGAGTRAWGVNSTAIGHGAVATLDNQVAIGTSVNTYTLAGINSQASKNAQSGTTYLTTTDAAGNLAASTFDLATLEALPGTVAQHSTQITTLTTNVTNLTTNVTQNTTDIADHETRITGNTNTLILHTAQINGLGSRVTVNETNIGLLDGRVTSLENGFDDLSGEISDNRTEARQGIAAAIAMATAPMPSAPGRTTWASNLGFFKGETAVGGSLTHRFDTDMPIGLTAGYSYGGGDSHAGRFGLMGEF